MAKLLRFRRPTSGKAPGMPSASGKRIDREGPIHREILDHLRRLFPKGKVHHSPNSIGLSGKQIMRQISRNESMGTIKGWPDLQVLLPGPLTLLFEVKAPANYPDPHQKVLHHELRALGCLVAVVRSVADVDAALAEWRVSPIDQAKTEGTVRHEK
ncbi:hypothetical protein ACEUZ9_002945 [Paracoccus litorisediminis]|uniref:VRR-NUC domain-containing protein n=1 Tax=Paracoccus litorisediminis TaxID=2006130 RepID=UPI0037346410